MKAREETIPPEAVTRIPEALKRLVELYTDWHAAEPDKGYDAKAGISSIAAISFPTFTFMFVSSWSGESISRSVNRRGPH